MKCKWCGKEAERKQSFCTISHKNYYENRLRISAKGKGLPTKCEVCGVVFIQITQRFTKKCPVCIRQNWRRYILWLTPEWADTLKVLIREGRTSSLRVSQYLEEHLKTYIRRIGQ